LILKIKIKSVAVAVFFTVLVIDTKVPVVAGFKLSFRGVVSILILDESKENCSSSRV